MKAFENQSNPFPGLRPFDFHENRLFFGREDQSKELLDKLRANRFVAVVGTSGSGKSSLVRAGLLPLLYGGFMQDAGPRWRIAVFRPGRSPLYNLAQALSCPQAFEPAHPGETEAGAGESAVAKQSARQPPEPFSEEALDVAAVEILLRRSARGLADYVVRAKVGQSENLLIVVDQFEEIFRFKEKSETPNPEDEAAAFVKLLLEAVREPDAPIYVILTMRSDFLGDCAQFRDLPEIINESQYLIPRMTRDQQRKAITCPAGVRGATMTPRLVQRLLNDVGDNPDHLPLLQHALMRT
jgi:energy-coupling factor transporter ATP-binding protein EcfA2